MRERREIVAVLAELAAKSASTIGDYRAHQDARSILAEEGLVEESMRLLSEREIERSRRGGVVFRCTAGGCYSSRLRYVEGPLRSSTFEVDREARVILVRAEGRLFPAEQADDARFECCSCFAVYGGCEGYELLVERTEVGPVAPEEAVVGR